MPLHDRLELYHRRQLFQQIGQRPPKVSVVPLQGIDFAWVNAAVGVHMDFHLVAHRRWSNTSSRMSEGLIRST